MLIKSIRMILFGVLNNHLKAKDTGAPWKIATSKVVYKFPLQSTQHIKLQQSGRIIGKLMTSKKSLHDEIVDICVELLVNFHVDEFLQRKQQFALEDDDNGWYQIYYGGGNICLWVTKEGLKITSQKTSGHFVFKLYCLKLINLLHPEIILHLLYSVLYKFPIVLEGEFVQQSMGF